MSKSSYSPEFKAKAAQEYIDEVGSIENLARKYKIGASTLREWINKYRIHGISAFISASGNKSYSKELKIICVEEVLQGKGTINTVITKYNISSRRVLRKWIKEYNAHRELKDYYPKREVYMADARRKTTIEERKTIVNYCINHDRNYKEAASLYGVSYNQVYYWVQKYDAQGEQGLLDKRGHHKNEDELDELERLRRENLRLKRQLEEKDMVVELLKKVNEFERM